MSTRPAAADALVEVLRTALEGMYEFEGQIGRGGYSLVFRVKNRSLGRVEALKAFIRVLDEEATARFLRETRVVARLDPPTSSKCSTSERRRAFPGTPCSCWKAPPSHVSSRTTGRWTSRCS